MSGIRIACACKKCRGGSVRAEHVEPVVRELVTGRLAMADAVDILRVEPPNEEQAERLRVQRQTLPTQRGAIADERADGLIDGDRAWALLAVPSRLTRSIARA